MKLRARWHGPSPKVGDYLMSDVRPRFAYRISGVTNKSSEVGWDATAKIEVRSLQIEADRVALSAVPEHARVHSWKWDRRQRKHV